MPWQSKHSMHLSMGELYSSGLNTPLHLPKHSWYTLKLERLGGSLASSGFLCRSALHRRSASVFVISPEPDAPSGKIPCCLRVWTWPWLHREQWMCSSSHTLWISLMSNWRSTVCRICGRHRRFSPPTMKQAIVSPSNNVSVFSTPLQKQNARLSTCCPPRLQTSTSNSRVYKVSFSSKSEIDFDTFFDDIQGNFSETRQLTDQLLLIQVWHARLLFPLPDSRTRGRHYVTLPNSLSWKYPLLVQKLAVCTILHKLFYVYHAGALPWYS